MASIRAKAKLIKHAKRQMKKSQTGKQSGSDAMKKIMGMHQGRKKFRKIKHIAGWQQGVRKD